MRTADHLVSFMELVNEELKIGTTAATALLATPPALRAALLSEHPEWLRTGTFDALLAAAREERARSLLRAEEITTFVLDHVGLIRRQPGGDTLFTLVQGTAYQEHAAVLYRSGGERLAAALEHVAEALRIFGERPALYLERSSARLVQAQIFQNLGQFTAALETLEECEVVFAEEGDAFRYQQVLAQRGFCYFELAERAHGPAAASAYRDAQAAFLDALAETERIGEQQDHARLLSNLGHCCVQLKAFDEARSYFEQSVHECKALGMTASLQHALWGIAEIDAKAGFPTRARALLEQVAEEFIARGWFSDAALVRFDLTVRLADELQEPQLVHDECVALASTAIFPALPPTMQQAITYFTTRTRVTADDVACAASFLDRYRDDTAATFEVGGAGVQTSPS